MGKTRGTDRRKGRTFTPDPIAWNRAELMAKRLGISVSQLFDKMVNKEWEDYVDKTVNEVREAPT